MEEMTVTEDIIQDRKTFREPEKNNNMKTEEGRKNQRERERQSERERVREREGLSEGKKDTANNKRKINGLFHAVLIPLKTETRK